MDLRHPFAAVAIFTCVGQGYGFVNIIWIRGSRGSPPAKSIISTMTTPDNITSTLTIPDLEERDHNNRYRCRYSNNEGNVNSNRARLTIGSKHQYLNKFIIY